MEDHGFDELTKAIGGSVSRRQLLKRFATGVAGVAFASLPGRAFASAGGLSVCAHFCASVFDDIDDLTGLCVSAAAHGQGLCFQCGPLAPLGAGPVCGVGTASAFCCSAGQTCCSNNSCVDLLTDVANCGSCGNACSPGQICQGGTCVTPGCPNPGNCTTAPFGCNGNLSCRCFETVESIGFCHFSTEATCAELLTCQTSLDCPAGYACATTSCCPGGVCLAPCPPAGTLAAAQSLSGVTMTPLAG